MRTLKLLSLLAGLAISVGAIASLSAAEKCEQCGNCCMKPVCRVVCEMKKVPDIQYKCVCEDFCLPGPSQKCGCKSIPTCGCPRTRVKLVKIEGVKEVPTYKCVVEYICCKCCQQPAEEPAKDPAPAPPASAANETETDASQAALLIDSTTQR